MAENSDAKAAVVAGAAASSRFRCGKLAAGQKENQLRIQMKFMKFLPLCAELKPRLCNIYHFECLQKNTKEGIVSWGSLGVGWAPCIPAPRVALKAFKLPA